MSAIEKICLYDQREMNAVHECILEKGSGIISNILQRDGLTIELLARLSYRSALGLNLKKNLHYLIRICS